MNARVLRASLFAIAVLAGCAGPRPAPEDGRADAALDCSALAAEIARAETERQDALAARQRAWTAVIPIAVAARYARSKREIDAAEKHLDDLRGQATAGGCAARG